MENLSCGCQDIISSWRGPYCSTTRICYTWKWESNLQVEDSLGHASKAWYMKIDIYLRSQGFTCGHGDCNLNIMQKWDKILFLALYVNNLLFIGNYPSMIGWFKFQLETKFEIRWDTQQPNRGCKPDILENSNIEKLSALNQQQDKIPVVLVVAVPYVWFTAPMIFCVLSMLKNS
jgi:hypothetical protein